VGRRSILAVRRDQRQVIAMVDAAKDTPAAVAPGSSSTSKRIVALDVNEAAQPPDISWRPRTLA
jgi:hypothetical protein